MNPEQRALSQVLSCLVDVKLENDKDPTEEEMEEAISYVLGGPYFQTVDQDKLRIKVRESVILSTEEAQTLTGDNVNHKEWLTPKKRASIEWKFWRRYRTYMLSSLPLTVVQKGIDQSTNTILGLLEDPEREGPWDTRGLVMGHVQSGKTSNYIGLICKAADAGYKVIIVLAGLHNNLREQTQVRLEEGFLGFDTTSRKNEGLRPVGVGIEEPGHKAHYLTRRFDPANPGVGDFQRTHAIQSGVALGDAPILFVVKKNKSVLENLVRWFRDRCDQTDPDTGKRSFRNLPLLLIDDESDQASIDISTQIVGEDIKPEADYIPSTINARIRELISLFKKSAYVGYTATPFANIFIDEKAYSDRFADDLFPRSFIHSLPVAENYTGAKRIFGTKPHFASDLESAEGLPIFVPVNDHANSLNPKEENGWMPPKLVAGTGHIPKTNGKRRIPESLNEAIVSFLISCAIRSARSDEPHHNSMLIHVTRLQLVQDEVKKQVEEALEIIQNDLGYLQGTPSHKLVESLWGKFQKVSSSDVFEEPCPIPTLDDLIMLLKSLVLDIKVKAIHGESDDLLDYDACRETGINVIVIGGDKLSRGLTLEGLTTSYFLRSSKMYDTLMQMGRWFGYRAGYEDLCRIYTTQNLYNLFGILALASEELREEFKFMERVKAKPLEFGLKVYRHPSMMITSRTKLKTGSRVRFTFAGSRPQILTYSLDNIDLKQNYKAFKTLIKNIGEPDKSHPTWKPEKIHPSWKPEWKRRIKPEFIMNFLNDYHSHEKARSLDPHQVAKYIERMNSKDELTHWSVMISGKKKPTPLLIDDVEVGSIYRRVTSVYPDPAFSIGVLTDPKDESCDLVEKEFKIAMNNSDTPDFPSGEAVRDVRPKKFGLVIIYPLDLESILKDREEFGKVDKSIPAIGLAISFPTTPSGELVDYQVNNIFDENSD